MDYPDIALKAFIDALDDNEDAYKFLSESKWKELAAFTDVFNSSDDTALKFLIVNKIKFPTIVNFLAALQNEEKAFQLLLIGTDKKWAAIVSSVHGSDEAYKWLEKNNLTIYTQIADVLIKNNHKGGYSGIGGMGGGSSSGGGGFGGFSGGSFGGAGSGGVW